MSSQLSLKRVEQAPTSAAFFEAKYAADTEHDPWQFALSDYEQKRYDAILQALPRTHYRYAFEPGCSIGVLTAKLAQRCDQILALDFAPTAIAEAKRRHSSLNNNVEFRCASLPEALIDCDGTFDLIVFAEIGYYFTPAVLQSLVTKLAVTLVDNGNFLVEHWTGKSADHVLDGDRTHQLIDNTLAWPQQQHVREDKFLLSCWRKPAQ
jgi:SAM-dependent methyltransferase